MTALSDYLTSVETLRTALATCATDAADVVSKAATAKIIIGDDVAAILLRVSQAVTAEANLDSHGSNTDVPTRYYLDGVFPNTGT